MFGSDFWSTIELSMVKFMGKTWFHYGFKLLPKSGNPIATYSECEGCTQHICEAKFDYPPSQCQLVAVFRQYGPRRDSLARTLCTPATPIPDRLKGVRAD